MPDLQIAGNIFVELPLLRWLASINSEQDLHNNLLVLVAGVCGAMEQKSGLRPIPA
ncbi:hypothetical protein [Ktedonobacter sp. SOSP1-52]|uniref:hypothetical protein n=1 Tax=Ktedonobacter sp. SOSP1-52 TaxID=2778366 RepID=UPI001915758A|nr:hypothetical protein [Ktedonobacter sp. SOSP1-52]